MTSPSWPERLPDPPTRRINHSALEAFLNHCPLTAIETSMVVKDSATPAADKIVVNRP
jgi:hypothetical protein